MATLIRSSDSINAASVGKVDEAFAVLVRLRSVLKTTPLALEKMIGQVISKLSDSRLDASALLLCARIGELLTSRCEAK